MTTLPRQSQLAIALEAGRSFRTTMDTLVLAALSCGRKDGFEVTRWIEERTKGMFAFDDGAVYRSLHRLEGNGWVDAAWGMTADDHRSRFYQLTARPCRPEHGVRHGRR